MIFLFVLALTQSVLDGKCEIACRYEGYTDGYSDVIKDKKKEKSVCVCTTTFNLEELKIDRSETL